MKTRQLWWVALCLTLAALPDARAHAEGDCRWVDVGSTRYLRADCTTDATLRIPDGVTLDGRGHRITAHDPPGGAFAGAVVQNAGASAHVRNLKIDAGNLAAVCHASEPVDTRVRAILLQDADGSVIDSQVLAVNQGVSGCQEGNGIEVRASREVEVLVRGNRIQHFQKGGIVLIGPIEAGIYFNRVEGQGPTDSLAQNGIQLSGGASGSVKFNHVRDVRYAPGSATAAGILLLDAGDGTEAALNRVEDTDVGIFLDGTSEAELHGNSIERSTYDGISLDGRTAPAQYNRIHANYVAHSGGVGIDLFGEGATHNLVKLNLVVASGVADVKEQLEAGDNVVVLNGALSSQKN